MLKIREFRKSQKMTIKELAELSGMSISYISQIERGEIDPSLSSLRKIAAGLQVPMHMLLDDVVVMGNLTIRKEQQVITYSEDHKVSYRFLTPFPSPAYSPEVMLIQFEIAAHAQDTQLPIRHHSEEMVYVTEGQLTVQIGDTEKVPAEETADTPASADTLPENRKPVSEDEENKKTEKQKKSKTDKG